MLTDGGFTSLPATSSPVVIPVTGFTPAGLFTVAFQASSPHVAVGYGVVAGSAQAAQYTAAGWDRHASTTTTAEYFLSNHGIAVENDQNVRYEALVSFQSNQFTVTPQVFGVGVELFWWAFDSDAWLKVFFGTTSNTATSNVTLSGDNVALTADAILGFFSRASRTAPNQSSLMTAIACSTPTRDIWAGLMLRSGTSLSQGAVGWFDSDDNAAGTDFATSVGLVNNNNFAPIEASQRFRPNGNDQAESTILVSRGGSGYTPVFGVGGLNQTDFACELVELPASGTLQVRGLGFEPKLIGLHLIVGAVAADQVSSNQLSSRTQPPDVGASVGYWSAQQEWSYGHVRSGDADTSIAIDTGNTIGRLPAPYSGTVTMSGLDADGFDLTVTGDGTQHYGIWFAWGEPSAAETELDGQPVTLGWSSSDAGVSASQTLDADAASFAFTASDVDVTAGVTLDLEAASFAWSTTEPAIDVFTAVDGVDSVFNFAAQTATIIPEEANLDAAAASFTWTASLADVIPAGVLGLDPVSLGWVSTEANVSPEEQTLNIDNALLAFQSTRANVMDEANLVSAEPVSLPWQSTGPIIVNEQVTPAPATLGWSAGNVNVFLEVATEHAHLVEVLRPDSLDVEVFSSHRRTRTTTQ